MGLGVERSVQRGPTNGDGAGVSMFSELDEGEFASEGSDEDRGHIGATAMDGQGSASVESCGTELFAVGGHDGGSTRGTVEGANDELADQLEERSLCAIRGVDASYPSDRLASGLGDSDDVVDKGKELDRKGGVDGESDGEQAGRGSRAKRMGPACRWGRGGS